MAAGHGGTARWSTPAGFTVEGMYLELTRPARRDYDPDGGDGTYLLIRDPGRQTVKYVTGQRPGRTDADALAEVDAVLARQGYGETIRDLARVTRRLPAAA